MVAKLREEVDELDAEVTSHEPDRIDRLRDELGDVLFVMANLARHLKVEPEAALQGANAKFMRRFQGMERHLQSADLEMRRQSLQELDRLWETVKAQQADQE